MSPEHLAVDTAFWSACAGARALSRIPTVGSDVYYLPKPHSEQSRPPASLSTLAKSKPLIRCRVLSVRHLAMPDSEEVFAAIHLLPVPFPTEEEQPLSAAVHGGAPARKNLLQSFAKILTQSDANNGGGFSVPRYCAENILPPLDYEEVPPVQTIRAVDIKGKAWEFRHIYRGTPKRHLLTTGWSRFVNSKRLVAGDSVVFMKNKSGGLYVGLRRRIHGGDGEKGSQVGMFCREVGGGRVPARAAETAAEAAARGEEFVVMWYPLPLKSRFVVEARVADIALRMCWTRGTRVKMSFEEDDCCSMTWFKGTVTGVCVDEEEDDCSGNWADSPLRMLQIEWDGKEAMSNMNRVSPWEVEQVTRGPLSELDMNFPKRIRVPPLEVDGDDELFPHCLLRSSFSYDGWSTHSGSLEDHRLRMGARDGGPFYPTGRLGDSGDRASSSMSVEARSSVVDPVNSIRLFGQVIIPGENNNVSVASRSTCNEVESTIVKR